MAPSTPSGDRPPPLSRLLELAARRLNARLHERLDAAGFDDQRSGDDPAFAHIPPEGIRLTDLAQRAGITKQAMAEVVDSLASRGYVERRPDPTDGRAKVIAFAPRGWAAIEVALEAFDDIERDVIATVGPRGIAELRRTLTAIIDGGA